MTKTVKSAGCPAWRQAGLAYHAYGYHLRARFGQRVQKVSIDAGFTCPNVDGTVAVGGCTFCDNRSFSPSRRLPRMAITNQINEGIRQLQRRYDCQQFIAYFQPATNTYAPVDRLRACYEQALSHPQVVGLAIGTRPDCIEDATLELLAELARTSYVSLELGIQTIHDRSLVWMNRGHDYAASRVAVLRCQGLGLELCAHLMLGLPAESHADMMATIDEIAHLPIDGVKLHNLYVVRDTPLADQYTRGEVSVMSREDYIATVVDAIERLPPTMIIERIQGDAPPDYLVAPTWCLDKPAVLNMLREAFRARDTWQGKKFVPSQTRDGNLSGDS